MVDVREGCHELHPPGQAEDEAVRLQVSGGNRERTAESDELKALAVVAIMMIKSGGHGAVHSVDQEGEAQTTHLWKKMRAWHRLASAAKTSSAEETRRCAPAEHKARRARCGPSVQRVMVAFAEVHVMPGNCNPSLGRRIRKPSEQ